MSEPIELFMREVAGKTTDKELHHSLSLARTRYNHAFDGAIMQFSNLETAKRRAAFARWKALENLDKYLIEFEANFIKAGGKVIWAQHAAEACSEIISIINRAGEKSINRCSSSTLDEIELDEQLRLNKKTVLRSGMGEYPMHVKKDQGSITGRDQLKTTSVGITGANFIVADAGAIAISENEGNILQAASGTKIHIVVAGIDKVIPSISDLHILFPIIAAYGTGKNIATYNMLLRGPVRQGEKNGPAEMYVVLIDNGRTKVMAEEVQRQVCTCIRCGACVMNDPVHSVTGDSPHKSTWIGPPGAVMLPHIHGMKTHGFFTHLSTLSAADSEICPVNINFNKLILDNRKKAADAQASGTGEKLFYFLWKKAMLKRELVNMKGIKARNFFMNNIFLKSPDGLRKMPSPAKESFNEIWRKRMSGH